jgi:hypothetical protein
MNSSCEVCFGVHSRCGLHTRAVTKTVTVIRRLQTFRLLHACSGCFRQGRSPGGSCTHWKSAALSRRRWYADIRTVFLRELSGCNVAAGSAMRFRRSAKFPPLTIVL